MTGSSTIKRLVSAGLLALTAVSARSGSVLALSVSFWPAPEPFQILGFNRNLGSQYASYCECVYRWVGRTK